MPVFCSKRLFIEITIVKGFVHILIIVQEAINYYYEYYSMNLFEVKLSCIHMKTS